MLNKVNKLDFWQVLSHECIVTAFNGSLTALAFRCLRDLALMSDADPCAGKYRPLLLCKNFRRDEVILR